jgi:hypothetical protein
VLAGNHDVSADDTRGTTPYLRTMGPQRFCHSTTFAGADASGYNTAHIFPAAGREWLLLAMDGRTSAAGFAWANQTIKDNAGLPVILTTHEIVGSTYDDNVYPYQSGDPENNAAFSDYGEQVWFTNNGFMAALSRIGEAGKAGKHGKNTDPNEPVMTLSISNNGREPQFNHYPLSQPFPTTNWGQGLPEDQWWHLSIVNDGTHSVLYVNSCPVVDNPSTVSVATGTRAPSTRCSTAGSVTSAS